MNRVVKFSLVLILLPLFVSTAFAKPEQVWIESKSEKAPIEIKLPSFAPIVEQLGKSVVSITTEGKELDEKAKSNKNMRGGSPLEEFFNIPPGGKKFAPDSLGSGFVIHPDGYILTNAHVVENASKIFVQFKKNKKKYEAEVVGKDKKTDIALLKIEGKKFDAVVLGTSSDVKAGDWVIAIGNPFRFGHTVTMGIVSATSRRVPGGGPYDDFIQTDASINPGNSGGPLFNASGEVIGINTAIYNPAAWGNRGVNIGIGFAIPVDMAKDVVSQLYESGEVVRGWLGVYIQPVSEDVAQALGVDNTDGALVADVLKDSPASKAKFQRGDVITTFDGQKVEENADLPLMVAKTKVGRTVDVNVVRNKTKKTLKVTIEKLTDETPSEEKDQPQESKLGMSLQEMNDDLASMLGLDQVRGVVVTSVVPNSVAARSLIRRGDIILQVGSIEITSVGQFRDITKDLKPNKPLLLLVRRGENTVFLTLKAD